MSSSKEVKNLVKAARGALDREEYAEAIKQCEAVFWLEDGHYLSRVIAGKACLQLKRKLEALTHYRKAISSNVNELLAWKGLVHLYDDYPPQDSEEKLEAIDAYRRILETVTDSEKQFPIVLKLARLYSSINQLDEATINYTTLLISTSLEYQLEALEFLLTNSRYSRTQWQMIEGVYKSVIDAVQLPSKIIEIKKLFLTCCLEWIKLSTDREPELVALLKEECTMNINEVVPVSRQVLLQLLLWECFHGFDIGNKKFKSEDVTQLDQYVTSDGTNEGVEDKVWLSSRCLLSFHSHNVKKAISLVESMSNLSCESCFLSCVCHMTSHDYNFVIETGHHGLSLIHEIPVYLSACIEYLFNLLILEAMLWEGNHGNVQSGLSLSEKLYMERSCDSHVTNLHARLLLANDQVQEVDEMLSDWSLPDDMPLFTCIQGHLCLKRKDYLTAHEKFQSLVSTNQQCGYYYYLLGYTEWLSGKADEAYPSLVKSAQLDSYNPYVFLLLGHYQFNITCDMNRAIKCYQKSFSMHPALVEAGISLAEALSSTGQEESANEVYVKITEVAPPTQAKEAWLRIGLYERGRGSCDEAIKCFLKVLHQNISDYNVWECLGEAYLSRGSHTSSLKAFNKAIELNPYPLYSLYQVSTIHQLLGQLTEAVNTYSQVLKLQSTYVPALKGRAETYYTLAVSSLEQVLDGRAVQYISLALTDLTNAIELQSNFICLWKLIGDSCILLYPIADNYVAKLNVPATLLGNKNERSQQNVTKEQLLQIGIRISMVIKTLKLLNRNLIYH